jgi:nitroimidazol reductase NimA-like FMN-containing flavoprotein (pyridoxamine 5'-phosphate oxidase superfamily)
VEVDRNGFEVLSRQECLRLLGTTGVGRLAVTTAALPTILPVGFHFDGSRILIRTGRGTPLGAATRNAVVAFEVDDISPSSETGWSVVVTGVARELTGVDERATAMLTPRCRWVSGDGDRVVGISTDIVSGRRLVATRPPEPAT